MSLLAVAHGSRDPRAQQAVEALLDAVRARQPGLSVRAAYLDHARPSVAEALAETPDAVVVPLLLSRGYHLGVDLGSVAPSLGPDPLLTTALQDRLAQAGAPPDVPVVLAAAGTSDLAGRADVEAQAGLLAAARRTEVTVAYLTDAPPRLSVRTAVAAYLLWPGHFADRLAEWGARWVSAPLADHPAVAELVLARAQPGRTAPA